MHKHSGVLLDINLTKTFVPKGSFWNVTQMVTPFLRSPSCNPLRRNTMTLQLPRQLHFYALFYLARFDGFHLCNGKKTLFEWNFLNGTDENDTF